MKKSYTISAKIWLYPGKAGWHFITVPKETSQDIDYFFSMDKKGWGSLPVEIKLGKSTWKTSIFPDKKLGSYVLPLKAQIRKQERINEGDQVNFSLDVGS